LSVNHHAHRRRQSQILQYRLPLDSITSPPIHPLRLLHLASKNTTCAPGAVRPLSQNSAAIPVADRALQSTARNASHEMCSDFGHRRIQHRAAASAAENLLIDL